MARNGSSRDHTIKILIYLDSNCEFYHVPYTNIKMWSDLTTPTGVMAAFSKEQVNFVLSFHNHLS